MKISLLSSCFCFLFYFPAVLSFRVILLNCPHQQVFIYLLRRDVFSFVDALMFSVSLLSRSFASERANPIIAIIGVVVVQCAGRIDNPGVIRIAGVRRIRKRPMLIMFVSSRRLSGISRPLFF